MNFVNNYMQPLALAQGALSAELSLPDGEYTLTLADSTSVATRWEVLTATVVSGIAALERGLEGTDDQPWPEGSVIYQAVTAGVLAGLQQQIADLTARVTALEPVVPLHPGELIAGNAFGGYAYGYSPDGLSSISPIGEIGEGSTVIPGGTPAVDAEGEILELVWYNTSAPYLRLAYRDPTAGTPVPAFDSFTLAGFVFAADDAAVYGGFEGGTAALQWPCATNPLPEGKHSFSFS